MIRPLFDRGIPITKQAAGLYQPLGIMTAPAEEGQPAIPRDIHGPKGIPLTDVVPSPARRILDLTERWSILHPQRFSGFHCGISSK